MTPTGISPDKRMARKHMKACPTSFTTGRCHRNSRRCHFTLTGRLLSRKRKIQGLGGCRQPGTLMRCRWGREMEQLLGTTVWPFPKRLNIVTMWPSNSTPKINENIRPHSFVHDVHDSVIHSRRIRKTGQVPTEGWRVNTKSGACTRREAPRLSEERRPWCLHNVDILQASELCAQEWLSRSVSRSVYFTVKDTCTGRAVPS